METCPSLCKSLQCSYQNVLKTVLSMDVAFHALTIPGVIITQVPVFISEIAPKGIRGGLATSNQVGENRTEVPLILCIQVNLKN